MFEEYIFTYVNDFYEHHFDMAIGSSLLPIASKISMDYFQSKFVFTVKTN